MITGTFSHPHVEEFFLKSVHFPLKLDGKESRFDLQGVHITFTEGNFINANTKLLSYE